MSVDLNEDRIQSTIQDMLNNDQSFKKEITLSNITDDKIIGYMNYISKEKIKYRHDKIKYKFNIAKPIHVFGESYISSLPFSSKFLLMYEILNAYFDNKKAFNFPVIVSNDDFCILFQYGSKSMLSFSSYILEKMYDDMIEYYKEVARDKETVFNRYSGLLHNPLNYSNDIRKQCAEEIGDVFYKSLSMNTLYNTSYMAHIKILFEERNNHSLWQYIKHYWKDVLHCIKNTLFTDFRYSVYTKA